MKKILLGLFLQIISIVLFVFPSKALAFSTNMEASVVIGQENFTDYLPGIGPNRLGTSPIRGLFVDPNGRLIIADGSNHRVLIFNEVPTSNGHSADIVLGQPDFYSNVANNGGRSSRSLYTPTALYSDGNKLFILDSGNGRILIWNTFPAQNYQPADIVVGKESMESFVASCSASSVGASGNANGLWIHEGKMLVSDNARRRVLIWNSIPTTNGIAADVVLGQESMTSCNAPSATSASSLNSPRGIMVDKNGRLFIVDGTNSNRVLMWNSIPTTNNVAAETVLGQNDFSSNTVNNTSWGMDIPIAVYSTGERIFVGANNHMRVMIWNYIPSINGSKPDIVIGQPDFQSFTPNNGGVSSKSMRFPHVPFVYGNRLLVSDSGNSRVLIFDNVVNPPTVGVGASPQSIENGQVRFSGSTSVDNPYSISNVEFAVNGGEWTNASSTDGSFDSTSEEYFFDFDPTLNQPNDSWGNIIEGYTVRIRSTNNNTDVKDRLFYFTPFVVNSPSDGAVTDNSYPSFEFSVNRQRLNMHDGLEKYQIMIKKGGSESQANWETLIDNIPIDFRSVKNNRDNLQWGTWGHLDTDNGVYETNNLYATYQNDSSTIKVYSKTPMSGSYEWKVVAVDKSGNRQETEAREILVNAPYTGVNTYNFPLAVLNISGLGNPRLNVFDILSIKRNYYTYSVNPVFYGIAWSGARVTLKLTDINCKADCSKTYATVANEESRFGINIPKGDLKYGGKYIVSLSSYLEGKYSQLPPFSLGIGALSYTTNAEVKN